MTTMAPLPHHVMPGLGPGIHECIDERQFVDARAKPWRDDVAANRERKEDDMGLAINCDMGESFGLYKLGDDDGIMPYITMANVACSFHGSDPSVMRKTVRLAKAHGVKGGAHPSLPDLQGFARPQLKN